jgi:hypothetical protein
MVGIRLAFGLSIARCVPILKRILRYFFDQGSPKTFCERTLGRSTKIWTTGTIGEHLLILLYGTKCFK